MPHVWDKTTSNCKAPVLELLEVGVRKVGDLCREWPEGSLSISTTPGRALLLSLDCSTFPLIRTLWCVKQRGIKYHFLSLWYDSTWDWTLVPRAIGENSNHYAIVHPLITITSMSTMNRGVRTYSSSMYGSNRYLWKQFVFVRSVNKKKTYSSEITTQKYEGLNWSNEQRVHQWSRWPGFNPRSSHTKN